MNTRQIKTFFSNDGILVAKVVNYDLDDDRFTIEPIRKLTRSINENTVKQVILFDLEHNTVYRLSDDLKIINTTGMGYGEFYKITRLCIRANNSSKLDFDLIKFLVQKDKDWYDFDENYRNQYNRLFNAVIDHIF